MAKKANTILGLDEKEGIQTVGIQRPLACQTYEVLSASKPSLGIFPDYYGAIEAILNHEKKVYDEKTGGRKIFIGHLA